LVEDYNVQSFVKAIQLADEISWDSDYIAASTQRFDVKYFKEQLEYYIKTPEYI
jgi:predicted DNA-binding protein